MITSILFADHIDLLKKAYFFVLQTDKHADYDSLTLLKILEVDPNFIIEYLDRLYPSTDVKSMRGYRGQDFSILWLQENHAEIIDKIVKFFYERGKSHYFTDLRNFFSPLGGEPKSSTVLERQDEYLQKAIKARSNDSNFVAYLFDMASDFSAERMVKLLSSFLECNKNFDNFTNLQIEPQTVSWSGSEVPIIQEKIDFYESILSLLNTIELLSHRNHIEQRISDLKKYMKSTIKREFIENQ